MDTNVADSDPITFAGASSSMVSLVKTIKETARDHFPHADSFDVNTDRIVPSLDSISAKSPILNKKGTKTLITAGFRNDSDTEQSFTFARSKKTSHTFSLSLSVGFQYKIHTEASLSIRGIFDIGGGQEFTFSLNSTTTIQKSVEETWSWSTNLKVPGRTRIEASAVCYAYDGKSPFTGKIDLFCKPVDYLKAYNPVYVTVHGGKKAGKYRWPIQNWVRPDVHPHFSAGENENHVIFDAQGEMRGNFGRHLMIHVKQFDLDSGEVTGQRLIHVDPSTGAQTGTTELGTPDAAPDGELV